MSEHTVYDILKKPIREIDWDFIVNFCKAQHRENLILDYKEEISKNKQQVEKIVSAFANTQGGVVLFGVPEKDDGFPEIDFGGMLLDGAEKSISDKCIGNITPPVVPEIKICKNPNDETKGVIIVRVEQSDNTPHCILGKAEFYERIKDKSIPQLMSVEKLAVLNNRRARATEIRLEMLKKSNDRILSLLRLSSPVDRVPYYVFWAVPLYPQGPLRSEAEWVDVFSANKSDLLVKKDNNQYFPLWNDIKKACTAHNLFYSYSDEDYGELNLFGLVVLAKKFQKVDKPGSGGFHGDFKSLFFDLECLRLFATKLYRKLGYFGKVDFGFSIGNCAGTSLGFEKFDDFKKITEKEASDSIIVLANELAENNPTKKLIAKIMMACNHGVIEEYELNTHLNSHLE